MPEHKHEDVKDQSNQSNWYILTVGLPAVPRPLTLAPGVSVRSIGEPLSVFDLAAAGAVGFRGWSVLEPVAFACKCEIESALDANVAPGYDTLNRAWLASSLLVLRGFTTHLCIACSRYSWQKIAGHQRRHSEAFRRQMEEESVEAAIFKPEEDLPAFTGDLLDFHLKILSDGKTQPGEVTHEDAQWVYSHYNSFNALAAESESFRFALEAATDWRYATDIRSAVARLWAGIEAMFGVSSELVYRISLLSASLTTPKGPQRKKRFDEVKTLYGMRSKIVHGDRLSEEKVHRALTMSYELLRELLLLSIERGHMLCSGDFDEAVFH
jgi:hypothetical protein